MDEMERIPGTMPSKVQNKGRGSGMERTDDFSKELFFEGKK